jgi:hypothetical protein
LAVELNEINPWTREIEVEDSDTHRHHLVSICEAYQERARPTDEVLRRPVHYFNVNWDLARPANELCRHTHSAKPEWVAARRGRKYVIEDANKIGFTTRWVLQHLVTHVNDFPGRIHRRHRSLPMPKSILCYCSPSGRQKTTLISLISTAGRGCASAADVRLVAARLSGFAAAGSGTLAADWEMLSRNCERLKSDLLSPLERASSAPLDDLSELAYLHLTFSRFYPNLEK